MSSIGLHLLWKLPILLTRDPSEVEHATHAHELPRLQHSIEPMLHERRRAMRGVSASPLRRLVLWSVLGWWLGLGSLLGLSGCAPHLPYPPFNPPTSLPLAETWARTTYQ